MKIVNEKLVYAYNLIPLDLSKIFFIILHHIDATNATPQQIHQWHLQNGWSGAGYNEYIRKDGTVHIMRGDNIGAQCSGMNSKSYGIALEGNYDVETKIPEEQFKSLIERCKYHKERLPNEVEICEHNKFVSTSCAGKYFPLNDVLDGVAKQPEKVDEELVKALGILVKFREINSPDYWLENATKGKAVNGEYAGIILKRYAEFYERIVRLYEEEERFDRSTLRDILRK